MYLRLGTTEDLELVKSMALKFFHASPYRKMNIAPDKVEALCQDMLTAEKNDKIVVILMTDDRRPVGLVASLCQEMLFSHDKVAVEILWWVDPEYRKRDSLRLIEAVEFWAQRVGARYQQVSALEDSLLPKVEKFYKRRKYKVFEHAYIKELV